MWFEIALGLLQLVGDVCIVADACTGPPKPANDSRHPLFRDLSPGCAVAGMVVVLVLMAAIACVATWL